jgi:5'(3')-deoxyribonucleotidase
MTNTHKKKIRLGLDLDGVIYNFVDEFRTLYSQKMGIDIDTLKVQDSWEFYKDWGMTDEDYYTYLGLAAIHGEVFCDGDIYPNARDSILKLKEMGFEIVIITARQLSNNPDHMKIIEDNTLQWLYNNNIAFDELVIDNDKSRHNLDILIDDNLNNVEALLITGASAYVFDQPWNRKGMDFPRVMGWYDLVSTMLRVQEGYEEAIKKFLSSNTPTSLVK